ncbi:MAG: hypothetical protein GY759_07745, partial [Chloroflexi bacterium]|nr:hypothetical protein [Chloroflexota bacterium]
MSTKLLLSMIVLIAVGFVGISTVHSAVTSDGEDVSTALGSTPSYDIELLSQVGGMVDAVAQQGQYAYVAIGWRLAVFDLTDPSYPVLVGRSDLRSGDYYLLEVEGDYLYALTSTGFRIYDISDPETPHFLNELVDLKGVEFQVVGGYAYVIADGLTIVDVRDPYRPLVIGRCRGVGGRDLHISNNYAYLASGQQLWVVDIVDPTAPTIVNQVLLPSGVEATSIHITGDLALLGSMPYGSGGSLLLFDVSDPLDIEQIG